MELPDFLNFKPFNTMRERMGTDRLGYFEMYDPKRHLSGEERSTLRMQGLSVPRSALYFLGDHTLAYKNSRVGLVVEDVLHVTRCKAVTGFEKGVVVADDEALVGGVSACKACLHHLRFDGLDLDKERKHHHNQRVIQQFSLARFFESYPDYPLFELTHVRHPL